MLNLAHMSVGNLLTRARMLAAGNSGRGLVGDDFEAWAVAQTQEHLLQVFRQLVEVGSWLLAGDETARAVSDEDWQRRATDAADRGQPAPGRVAPGDDPCLLKWRDMVAARLSALGIPHRYAVNERLAVLSRVVAGSYRHDGEPDALIALRKAITAAKRAAWERRVDVEAAQRVYRGMRDAEAEADVHRACEALAQAERACELERRKLWAEWAVRD
jgi:hypothetical protein